MNRELLKKAFREAKKAAGLDFAITNPDGMGDCQSCVWSAIVDRYGDDSRGVWVKHWRRGMNGGAPVEDLHRIYVAHDLTDEQGRTVVAVLSQYFRVDWDFSRGHCIKLEEA